MVLHKVQTHVIAIIKGFLSVKNNVNPSCKYLTLFFLPACSNDVPSPREVLRDCTVIRLIQLLLRKRANLRKDSQLCPKFQPLLAILKKFF